MTREGAPKALGHLRICDFTGQLAGAGATRFLAAFGAQVIRIEDPTNRGRWDILRGAPPFPDKRRGNELGSAFNNHNVEKLGITLNVKHERGRELLRELVKVSDVVSENFAAGVMNRLGFGYDTLKELKPDIIYVSNCGFGGTGPYWRYKSWGPIAQAMSGLTLHSGLPDMPPAGWGYSYMDHTGGYYMAIGILAALLHRSRTGEGQWVDMSCTEAGAALNGPALLDYTVNGRGVRRPGSPDTNRSQWAPHAPHGIYPARGDDEWIALACRSDDEWRILASEIGEPWAGEPRWADYAGRAGAQDELDKLIGAWTAHHDRWQLAGRLRHAGIPAAAVSRPDERIDDDANTAAWPLWPTVEHREIGQIRVDGMPVHLSETDWTIERGAPCLGEHNDMVYSEVLGLSAAEIDQLREEGVI
ncbi:MAG: CaiB/BaiF CoA transferase family protein [Acidimicrobiales bacterium]